MLQVIHIGILLGSCLNIAWAEFDGDTFLGSLETKLSVAACFRLFTNDGDIGCRTPSDDGSSGVLVEVRSVEDIDMAKGLGLDVVYAVPGTFFNSSMLDRMEATPIKGLILMDDSDTWLDIGKGIYSTDVQSPQGTGTYQASFTVNPSQSWNPFGNGFAYRSLR
jgi:hypothetical protein